MEWKIDFYKCEGTSPVEEWLLAIDKSARSKLMRNIGLLKSYGLELKMPYVRPIGHKLFEVRAKDSKGIYRILYFAYAGKKFVMLHGFTKKTQKTPNKEITIAMSRMEEVQNG